MSFHFNIKCFDMIVLGQKNTRAWVAYMGTYLLASQTLMQPFLYFSHLPLSPVASWVRKVSFTWL